MLQTNQRGAAKGEDTSQKAQFPHSFLDCLLATRLGDKMKEKEEAEERSQKVNLFSLVRWSGVSLLTACVDVLSWVP